MGVTEHYFSQVPNVQSSPKTISISARGVTLRVTTDSGVFSKDELDKASQILIEHVKLGPNAEAVDLGCGYGPVTSILAQVYPDSVWTMVDVNERAIELARRNTESLNGRVTAIRSDGFVALPDFVCTDIILNPPIRAGKQVVYRLFEESKEHLKPKGSLWIVIQKKHGAPSTHTFLAGLFEQVEICHKKAGYYVFHCF